MANFVQDLRYALRMLFKSPGFTAIAVIALALGIGANSAIFSIVNSVLLRPFPYPEPEELVMVWATFEKQGGGLGGTSYADYLDYRARNHSFEQLGALYSQSINIAGDPEPERLHGAVVTPSYFETLGVTPMLGRGFLEEEAQYGRHQVAVVSEGVWRRRFGANPKLIGQTLQLNGQPHTVVGVLPTKAQLGDVHDDIFVPMAFATGDLLATRSNHFITIVARLKDGVTLEQARTDVKEIAKQVAQEHPDTLAVGADVTSVRETVVGPLQPLLLVMTGAVGFVLLIACANVANLLLARAARRKKEIAVRAALGASRGRLVRQMLTESTLLGLAGGSLGLVFALWGVELLLKLSPSNLPVTAEIEVDARVLAFTIGVSILTGLLFGLAPALQLSGTAVYENLKEGARGTAGPQGRRLRGALVVGEVALSLVLLVGAGLMLRSFVKLQEVEPGFRPEHVLTLSMSLPESQYSTDAAVIRFYHTLLERVRVLPGVEAAGTTSLVPLSDGEWGKGLSIVGKEPATMDELKMTRYRQVSPEYLQVIGASIRKGRPFEARDETGSRVVLINEALAKKYFPGEDPIGQRLFLGPPEHLASGMIPPGFRYDRLQVVGVVADMKERELGREVEPTVFGLHAHAQDKEARRGMHLVVRTAGDPLQMAKAVRAEVAALDPNLPVASISTLENLITRSLAQPRFNAMLLGIFAGVALLLAVVGLYGVMSYTIAQRTHEIGIRVALGARPRDVVRLVVRQGMRLALLGVAGGLVAAFGLARLISGMLFGVSASDPVTFAGVSMLLAGVALLASYVPARRALKVDPMVALREE